VKCSVSWCDSKAKGLGVCGDHQKLRSKCSVSWCARHVEASGLCSGHRKRRNLGQDMEAPFNEAMARSISPRERLIRAALEMAPLCLELKSGKGRGKGRDIYSRAIDNLSHAAEVYVATLKAPSNR